MGKKDAPAAPDYTGAATAQGESSKELATQQTWANRPTVSTPWGSQSWSATPGVDPSTGQQVTQWQQNIKLSPEQQAALDSQMRIQQGRSGAAEGLLGQATEAFNTPMDWSNLPDAGQVGNDFRQQAQDAVTAYREPMQQRRQGQLETQLANMGLSRGSEAWDNEMQTLRDQFARDDLAAIESGRAEAQYGLGQAAAQTQQRQQAIAEGGLERSQRLNELNALLTGQQVSNPSMPSFNQAAGAQAPNYMQAAGQAGQAAADIYGANMQNASSTTAGLGSLAMAAAYMWSDERLKTDLVKLGTLKNGVEVWSYRYLWGSARHVGVLAQQAARHVPEAVLRHWSGFFAVDYRAVLRGA
jgi:hypothetical protein